MRASLRLILCSLGLAVISSCGDDEPAAATISAVPDASCPPTTTGSAGTGGTAGAGGAGGSTADAGTGPTQDPFMTQAQAMLEDGRKTFRYETFGDEAFWGDTLKLHQAIAGSANGGVGPGLTPTAALAAGLKVDAEAIPASVAAAIKAGQVSLTDPASTLAILKLNAVVGVTGKFDAGGALVGVGIQCALCHSTVDDSFAPGIGKRLDGWPNRDLNVGAIVSMAPNLAPVAALLGVDETTLKAVLASWGPGKFDAEVFLDGKAFQPDGKTSAATLIPAAFGLAGVNLHTYTGWGSVTYWNAFVANLEMHGKGNFYDPRLAATGADGGAQFPIAVKSGAANARTDTDLITPKLANLQLYQLAIPAPTPPAGSFDAAAAMRGQAVFSGAGKCATCHIPPLFTEPGYNAHLPSEIGIDDFQASRSPDRRYRTTPLKGLFAHAKGGFYHDGRYPTLEAVVDHYDTFGTLGLTAAQKGDLVQYLKSL
jgi:hypothetical protein